MSFFATPTDSPLPKSPYVRPVCLGFAGIIILMVVAQLFTFEDFPEVIARMDIWNGGDYAALWAAVIVTFEVFMLPFLLGMRLSILMRFVSMVAGWCVVAVWLATSVWADKSSDSGLLGATATLASGAWMTFFCLALAVLMIWASWGMWPLSRQRSSS